MPGQAPAPFPPPLSQHPYQQAPYQQQAPYEQGPYQQGPYQQVPAGQAPPGEGPFGQTSSFGLLGAPTGELLPTELNPGGPDPFASWYSPSRTPQPGPPEPETRQPGTGQLDAPYGRMTGPPLPPQGFQGQGFQGQGSRHAGGTRSRRPPVPVIAVGAVALAVILVVVFLTRGSGSSGNAVTMSTPTATASGATGQTEQQAAGQLARLLAQSGSDRGDVVNAVVDVKNCGHSLARDQQVFSRAAGNRRTLLARLGSLPGRAALPAQLVTVLTGAWQASAQVDTDLASWAGDQARGCTKKKAASDPHLQASYAFDGKATADKQAAVKLWNPIAARYHLTKYQWEQL